jgi:hypothetical protein
MTLVDLIKSKDERKSLEREAIEAYAPKSDHRSSKGQHLDVDGVLARSFKEVNSTSPALNQQSFEQVKAT